MQWDTELKYLLQQEGGGTSDVENEVSGWDESEPEVIACDSAEAAPHPASANAAVSSGDVIWIQLMLKLSVKDGCDGMV